MKNLLLSALIAIGAVSVTGVVIGLGMYYAGRIDVSADTPHSTIVLTAIESVRDKSIARQARKIVVPNDLSDPGRVRRGAGNYAAMCVNCHLSPGVENSEIRLGLYPTPPNLTKNGPNEQQPDAISAQQFWVIKHGIKASGMPAWSRGGMDDSAIWDMTAFLRRLPNTSPAQYRSLVAASDGHVHHGMDDGPTEEKAPHAHDPDAKPHLDHSHDH